MLLSALGLVLRAKVQNKIEIYSSRKKRLKKQNFFQDSDKHRNW